MSENVVFALGVAAFAASLAAGAYVGLIVARVAIVSSRSLRAARSDPAKWLAERISEQPDLTFPPVPIRVFARLAGELFVNSPFSVAVIDPSRIVIEHPVSLRLHTRTVILERDDIDHLGIDRGVIEDPRGGLRIRSQPASTLIELLGRAGWLLPPPPDL